MIIRPLEFTELGQLKEFTPPNWSGNIFDTYNFHFGKPNFHPFVTAVDKCVAGCVIGIN